jgi:hypothetical protein
MNVIETRYRLMSMEEELAYEDSKLAVIEIEARLSDPDRDRLRSASWHIHRAIIEIRSVSLTSSSDDLTRILEASIDTIENGH